MFLYPDKPVNSTALPLNYAPPDARPVEVDMLTIDYVVEEFQLGVPEVIKMDTQGCELSILQGGTRTLPKVDVLLLECWLTRAYGPTTPLLLEVADWLRQFDFHIWDLANAWRDDSGVLVAQDCLFLNARSKISRLKDELPSPPQAAPVIVPPPEALFQRVKNLIQRR
jgi:hypothetical protein